MTQEATPDSVVGAFDGKVRRYWGVNFRPVRRGDQYYFEYLDDQLRLVNKLPIVRTVGSHRYQQYLTQDDGSGPGNYWRLPLLWHIGAQRWVHLNGAFLGSDDQTFDSHLALWNQNCIFCHNTGPKPGITNLEALLERARQGDYPNFQTDPRFESEVAELGIACETCHSPGADHAERNRNPLRRYALHLSGADDPSIVNPKKLHHEASTQVCGQCHGQRIPLHTRAIFDWLKDGPSFRAGLDLTEHVVPLDIDTPSPTASQPDIFKLRFWLDGTPRLSAYEYQGISASACYTEGDLSCLSCHSLHQGDPAGNITRENRGNKPCLECHQHLGDDVTQHTRHAADSAGSMCRSCHMPDMVYGIMGIHISHQIERPTPALQAAQQRPDACTNCHIDKSVNWAQQAVTELWGQASPSVPTIQEPVPRVLLDMLSGDPVQRAVATWHAGRLNNGDHSRDRVWIVPFLLVMLEDRYPIMRWFAQHALQEIDRSMIEAEMPPFAEALDNYDFIGPAQERLAVIQQVREAFRALDKTQWMRPVGVPLDEHWEPDWNFVNTLIARQVGKDIDIGE